MAWSTQSCTFTITNNKDVHLCNRQYYFSNVRVHLFTLDPRFELADPDRACLLLALMQTSRSHALRSVNGPKADIVS